MRNPNWDRWIYASVTKYFSDNKGDFDLYFEGDDYDTNAYGTSPKKVEFRMTGPDVKEDAKDQWCLDYEINCLVSIIRDDKNIHTIYNVTGSVSSILNHSIPVFKFGDGPDDDSSYLGCFELISRIKTVQLGEVQASTPVLMATVEGQYRIQLEI